MQRDRCEDIMRQDPEALEPNQAARREKLKLGGKGLGWLARDDASRRASPHCSV